MAVNFSIASVTYDIFSNIEVKYYDPINKKYEYNNNLIKELSKQYYSGLSQYVDNNLFDIYERKINNKSYYKINIDYPIQLSLYKFRIYEPKISLLLDTNIRGFAENGFMDFDSKQFNGENIYIDTDGVGIIIDN